MGDSHVGLQARLMSQALRKLSGGIRQSNAAMIFTNQIRMKIGVMFGSPETTSGGNALKFYASVRVDMRRIASLKGPGDVVVGNRTRAKVVKNKVAPPFRIAEFDILFGKGIDRVGDVLDLAANAGVVDKSGAWLSWKETRLGQGRDKARELLLGDPALLAALEAETWAALGPAVAAPPTPASPATPAAPSATPAAAPPPPGKADAPKAAGVREGQGAARRVGAARR
jgi:recombination protein RecA